MRKRSYPSALSESVLELLGSRETLSFRSVRRQYLPYFFAFPLAMIFINVENFFLVPYPGTAGLSVTTYAFFAFTAGAIPFFVCCRDDNTARISKYAAILAAAGLVPWLVMPAGLPSFLCLLILMAGIGGCVSCSSFPFVFVLNNAERFYFSRLCSYQNKINLAAFMKRPSGSAEPYSDPFSDKLPFANRNLEICRLDIRELRDVRVSPEKQQYSVPKGPCENALFRMLRLCAFELCDAGGAGTV